MQFREQGKKIQCIRSTYDPISKRSRQKLVVTFDRDMDKLPSMEITILTETERNEFESWFNERQEAKAERLNQHRVMSAVSTLAELAISIKATGAAMTDSEATLTWRALGDVVKALHKVGHPKPKRKRSTVVVPTQVDLLTVVEEPLEGVSPSSPMSV